MGRGGFEPPKQYAADLQSVPFGHSGIHPYDRFLYQKPMIGLEPITCWLQISCSANWATSAYYIAQLICNQPALPTIVSLHSTIVMNWVTSAYYIAQLICNQPALPTIVSLHSIIVMNWATLAYTISARIIVQMIFIRNQSVPFNTYYIVPLTVRQLII